MPQDWVSIGRILHSRGNRGELAAEFDSNDPERPLRLKSIQLRAGTRVLDARVEDVWLHGDRPILKLEGIDSISSAEPWDGAAIFVAAEDLAPLGDGEYSFAQLIGCRVIASGQEIGVVDRIEEYGGPLLLAVAKPGGGEVLVPFAHSICKEIDVANKRIVAELPEGLLEL